MVPDEFKNLQWLAPWYQADHSAEAQLKKEVGPGHPLFRYTAIAVGRRSDNDDVLFFLPGHSKPLAMVHLTSSGGPSRDRQFPSTIFYSSLHDWVEACMKRDNREYSDGQ